MSSVLVTMTFILLTQLALNLLRQLQLFTEFLKCLICHVCLESVDFGLIDSQVCLAVKGRLHEQIVFCFILF